MNYAEALHWLYGTQPRGIKPGLARVERLLATLRVEIHAAGGPRYLHVAGTNGKGSVCAMLDSICRAAGKRTGLFTSPHLIKFRERIRVNGEMISEDAVAEGLTRQRALTESWDEPPTFFEMATALAFEHFLRAGVEIAVLETGLGGRLDSTNVVRPEVSILTAIDLDHRQWLGDTLPEIAAEKAGIIKPGVPVVSLPQSTEVHEVFVRTAAERGSPLSLVLSPLARVELGLAGSHQRWNAALAVHALDAAGLCLPAEAITRGLREVEWPGRFQTIGACVLDGAHNPGAARRLAETWQEIHDGVRPTLILGMLGDKDGAGVCAPLLPLAARAIAVPVRNPRSLTPEEVRALVQEIAPGLPCSIAKDATEAISTARGFPEPALIAGSLFLVGEALAHLTGQTMDETSSQ